MAADPRGRLRAICLDFAEAAEQETWGRPTYRVRNKIFAMERADDGRLAVWFKAPPGAQEILIEAAPDRFFRPPYVGPKGWLGLRLDGEVDWEEAAGLIARSYRMIAPKRLAELVP